MCLINQANSTRAVHFKYRWLFSFVVHSFQNRTNPWHGWLHCSRFKPRTSHLQYAGFSGPLSVPLVSIKTAAVQRVANLRDSHRPCNSPSCIDAHCDAFYLHVCTKQWTQSQKKTAPDSTIKSRQERRPALPTPPPHVQPPPPGYTVPPLGGGGNRTPLPTSQF